MYFNDEDDEELPYWIPTSERIKLIEYIIGEVDMAIEDLKKDFLVIDCFTTDLIDYLFANLGACKETCHNFLHDRKNDMHPFIQKGNKIDEGDFIFDWIAPSRVIFFNNTSMVCFFIFINEFDDNTHLSEKYTVIVNLKFHFNEKQMSDNVKDIEKYFDDIINSEDDFDDIKDGIFDVLDEEYKSTFSYGEKEENKNFPFTHKNNSHLLN